MSIKKSLPMYQDIKPNFLITTFSMVIRTSRSISQFKYMSLKHTHIMWKIWEIFRKDCLSWKSVTRSTVSRLRRLITGETWGDYCYRQTALNWAILGRSSIYKLFYTATRPWQTHRRLILCGWRKIEHQYHLFPNPSDFYFFSLRLPRKPPRISWAILD